MSDFDGAGGPWGHRLRYSSGRVGVDIYIEGGTFSNEPLPRLQGTIPDQTIYVGPMADQVTTFLERHNWFNQGAQLRATMANYPGYPNIAVVDYHNLVDVSPALPELVVQAGGVINLNQLLPLLNTANNAGSRRRSLHALLGSCAASPSQRASVANALGLGVAATSILTTHGVLVEAEVGSFTAADYAAIDQTLALLPNPVKDMLHLIVLDEAMPAAGGYQSGGIIVLNAHAGALAGFTPYPSGAQLPSVDFLQTILVHEVGHMCDFASVGLEANRYETIYASGATDSDAFLYRQIFPLPSEDIIFYFIGYCNDSATILGEVAARQNPVLTRKLAHTIDLLPSPTIGTVPFFSTNPVSHVTSTQLVPATRWPAMALGDDGMITSVNGVVF